MNSNSKQFVMLHDEKRCIGCQACTVACKVINDIPEGYSRLQVQIQGPHNDEAGDPHYQFFRVSCQHCEDAPAFLSALQVLHLLMKMALYRLKKSSVLAVITVLVLVLITFDISIH